MFRFWAMSYPFLRFQIIGMVLLTCCSTWNVAEVAPQAERPKVLILGSGPNRIGQGIEFDYSCVHAVMALRAAGFETVMVNCNPETVSTDYDTADRLYFEPLTLENVLAIFEREKPEGVIIQLGGQTPLKLAASLQAAGVPILGTSPDAVDLAEDRKRFGALLNEEGILQPANGTAVSEDEAVEIAPVGDRLVVFESLLTHEVLPVRLRERRCAFTLWLSAVT